MSIVIGEKDVFAIEYRRISNREKFANVILYFEGHKIGCFDEESYLPSVIASLKRISESCKLEELEQFHSFDKEQFIEVFLNTDSGSYDSYIASLGESFDDYFIKFFPANGFVVFIWQMAEEPYRTYDYAHKGVFLSKISIPFFINICNLFFKAIQNLTSD